MDTCLERDEAAALEALRGRVADHMMALLTSPDGAFCPLSAAHLGAILRFLRDETLRQNAAQSGATAQTIAASAEGADAPGLDSLAALDLSLPADDSDDPDLCFGDDDP